MARWDQGSRNPIALTIEVVCERLRGKLHNFPNEIYLLPIEDVNGVAELLALILGDLATFDEGL